MPVLSLSRSTDASACPTVQRQFIFSVNLSPCQKSEEEIDTDSFGSLLGPWSVDVVVRTWTLGRQIFRRVLFEPTEFF